jgi:hypothetical protein
MLDLLQTWWRILTLRFSEQDLEVLDWRYLVLGLASTWLVGMGRYWDNPRVGLAQALGFGSLAYVFVLGLYLFLIVWPLRPRRWSYGHVLTFITLTSPPAALYAIPVEMVAGLGAGQRVNLLFLAIVAGWRVALYSLYLRRWAGLTGYVQASATLLPLALIVFALMLLNLEHAVFAVMAGNIEPTTADAAYLVIVILGMLVRVSAPVLIVLYLIAIGLRWWQARHPKNGT